MTTTPTPAPRFVPDPPAPAFDWGQAAYEAATSVPRDRRASVCYGYLSAAVLSGESADILLTIALGLERGRIQP